MNTVGTWHHTLWRQFFVGVSTCPKDQFKAVIEPMTYMIVTIKILELVKNLFNITCYLNLTIKLLEQSSLCSSSD